MSRLDRLKKLQDPQSDPQGAASDKGNIDFWINRASENSKDRTTRAKGRVLGGPQGSHGKDAPKLPSTTVTVRDSSMKPKVSRKVDAAMAGKDDLNHVGGSDYMKSVRREA
jgi:hypothetical protein